MGMAKRILDSLFARPLVNVLARAGMSRNNYERERQIGLRKELQDLQAEIEAATPGNPAARGFKAYAQTDEDGIIQDILARIDGHSRTFIEIGCGRGEENNTHYLAVQGYSGCWIDGNPANIAYINERLGGLTFDSLQVIQSFITLENAAAVLKQCTDFLGVQDVAFFSLDIDGNDLHIAKLMLQHIKPLVVCVEYNPLFPPPVAITVEYDPEFNFKGDDYHSASLQAFCDAMPEYRLVACNLSGANAFFVREDKAGKFGGYSPAQLHQPFRGYLIGQQSTHKPTLKWLRDRLSGAR
jgi:hypothetical protein